MCPRHQPDKTHQGSFGNRPDNPPIGPTGPSPDKVRRMNSERHHPANFIGKTLDPAPGPDQGPRLHPKRYSPTRTRHTMVAQTASAAAGPRPPARCRMPAKFADFDPGGDAAMQIESPIRPPMRLTRDGRIKPRDFGRRH